MYPTMSLCLSATKSKCVIINVPLAMHLYSSTPSFSCLFIIEDMDNLGKNKKMSYILDQIHLPK